MIDDEFYKKVYRLEYIIRYSNVPRIHDESVASHSFFVCCILMKLYDLYAFNLGDALKIAVSHDIPEYATNDMSHETKRMYPEIVEILKKVEQNALVSMPMSIKVAHKRYEVGTSSESLMVHIADAIQCNQYAKNEISLGNLGYMTEVEQKSRLRVEKLLIKVEGYKRGPE